MEHSVQPLLDRAAAYLPAEQVARIEQAFQFACDAHAGQKRKSGEDYIWHPVAVAEILAEHQLDHESLIAALLHDVIEDTPVTKQEVAERFGDTVAELVDGVTKLGKIKTDSHLQAQAENFRKMMLAMSRDLRVILIKLADRLHNMRTLGVMRPDKQRRIASETLEIYAPIAARLGINAMRIELEDLGFKAMHPWRYCVLEHAVKKARGPRRELVNQITDALQQRLEQEKVPGTVQGREKHLYSLYKKMRDKRMRFEEILDLFAFRIITDSVDACYRALGVVHQLYKPLPFRFKDYIAIPKPNGYQSLHTVVFGPHGSHIEVQIRTRLMHEVAEHGIAAHWDYKESGSVKPTPVETRAKEWIKHLLEIQQNAGNSVEFLENVKVDLFPDVIYVFTPKGDIVSLPKGATPVDFAYHVHTNLGHACIGAKVDKELVPLRTQLESGQTVEIIKGKELQPNPSWLDFVVTPKARTQIRNFLKHQTAISAKDLGRRLLTKALLGFNLSCQHLTDEERQRILDALGIESWEALLEKIGLGERNAQLVAKQIHDLLSEDGEDGEQTGHETPTLAISGTEGLAVRFANCCHPIPGDDIIGFISSGKGLVIHRANCRNVQTYRNQPDKWLDVKWEEKVQGLYHSLIQLEVENRRGALAEIATTIARTGTDIAHVQSEDKDETYSLMQFDILVRDRKHLAELMRTLKRVPIVQRIQRL
ncbi:bifunctional (p)ppGpp synthetase/guanosine-3',5'-bis(diphosphate) 3'-pyrophosphohydrolase [Sulfurivirga sp.]|uniref:RelA/SpoT family protein n=1 Tax=Sulfurivirga sp. TaxID=2614236 RepID=UPI0025F92B98|nr:bifunctional (p)ppGpp synthetase/guanosine-3',5'-bis(diphosphate) 3'-pyrophosphohydrolase [Sulfurivirga sp.]